MNEILSNALGNTRRLNQYKKSNTESRNINGFIEWFIRLEKKKQEGLLQWRQRYCENSAASKKEKSNANILFFIFFIYANVGVNQMKEYI